MRYVWLVEGEPFAGPLRGYANALSEAAHSDVSVSEFVWCGVGGELRKFKPARAVSYNDDGDLMTVWLNVANDEARYHVDLRV